MKAILRALYGPWEGIDFDVTGGALIGRSRSCDIVVPHPAVSARHARIYEEKGTYFIEDLDSTNGTYINGERMEKAELKNGDRVAISSVELRFELREGTETSVEIDREVLSVERTLEPKTGTLSFFARREADLAEKLRTVYEITDVFASTLDPVAVVNSACSKIRKVYPQASTSAVFKIKGDVVEPMWVCSSETDVRLSRTVLAIVRRGRAVLSRSVRGDPELSASKTLAMKGIASLVACPLFSEGRVTGLLCVETKDPAKPFSGDDLALLSWVANEISAALERARLHEELLDRERLRQELNLAQTVQERFLLKELPDFDGYRFGFLFRPEAQVAGDFYDLIPVEDRVFCAVGDVAGKGMGAALLMVEVLSYLRFLCAVEKDVPRVMSFLNERMHKYSDAGFFVTLVLAEFHPDGRVKIGNAGHIAPFYVAQKVPIILKGLEGGFPLGVARGESYAVSELELKPDEYLLFVTDGIYEQRLENGAFYGEIRLVSLLQEDQDAQPQAVVERIFEDLSARVRTLDDDATAVVAMYVDR